MSIVRASRVDGGGPISVVIPTYGGARSLAELCARIGATLDAAGERWEIVLVDDASPDETPAVVAALCAAEPRIRGMRHPANRGQHQATVTGLRECRGSIAVTIDDDLQQWPEDIPLLLAATRAGHDVVIGSFRGHARGGLRDAGSRLVGAILTARHAKPKDLQITSFKAMSRLAIDAILAPARDEVYLAARILAAVPRERIVNVPVRHSARVHGSSGYTLRRMAAMTLQLLLGNRKTKGQRARSTDGAP